MNIRCEEGSLEYRVQKPFRKGHHGQLAFQLKYREKLTLSLVHRLLSVSRTNLPPILEPPNEMEEKELSRKAAGAGKLPAYKHA